MFSKKLTARSAFSTLAIAGCLLGAIPAVTLAQSLPGLTIFSGVKPEYRLGYRLDFGGHTNAWDRYRLRVPAKKMKLAVAQFSITYPNYYKGKFDPKDMEIRVKGKKVPLQEVNWNKENRVIELIPQEPIPANSAVELVFSNVKNPSSPGIFYFNCQILSPGDVPLLRYLGTWELSVS
jgi:hypothetical protein